MNDEDLKRLIERTADVAVDKACRQFEAVTKRLESKIELVAEGVVMANERIDRLVSKVDELRSEIKAEFNDVRSMMQTRVERLETSTH